MAKKVLPLTNTQVKQAKVQEKNYAISDGDGLQLRVQTNGSKLWVLKYSHPISKKRTNISFGKYPDVSLADARNRRADAKKLLANNIDPKSHRDQVQQQGKESLENTFGVFAEKWFELKKQSVKPETAEKAYQSLEKHILPSLVNVPIQDIKPLPVIRILEPVKAKGSFETVKRLCRIINEIMRLAVASGHIEVNYLAEITKLFPAAKKQHMATIKPERLPELMQQLHHANITKTTRCLIEFQLHTMTRPIEAATARWCDINLDDGTWTIPAERMKMKKPHTIPLTDETHAILEVMQGISQHREFILPSHRDPRKHTNSQTANMAIKRMGFAGELVSHGLRALASTTLNEQGFAADIIESALAHVDKNEIRRAYNRATYLEQRKTMMCWWSSHITNASYGSNSVTGFKHLEVVNG